MPISSSVLVIDGADEDEERDTLRADELLMPACFRNNNRCCAVESGGVALFVRTREDADVDVTEAFRCAKRFCTELILELLPLFCVAADNVCAPAENVSVRESTVIGITELRFMVME